MAQPVKNTLAMWETLVQSLGWKDPLKEGMSTHSCILAWTIPMDRGAWWATVHGVTESDMTVWLSTAQHMGHFRNFSLNSSPWNFAMMDIFRNLFSCIKFMKGPFYSGDPNSLFPGTFCIIIFLSCVMTSFYFICSFWKSCHLNVILFQFFFFFSHIFYF